MIPRLEPLGRGRTAASSTPAAAAANGILHDRRIVVDGCLKSAQAERRRHGHPGLREDLDHVFVGVSGQRTAWSNSLDDSSRRYVRRCRRPKKRRRIDFVATKSGCRSGAHPQSRAAGEQIRQPDIGLEHVIVEPPRTFELEIHDRFVRRRRRHRVVRTPAVEQVAGREHRGPIRRPTDGLLVLERVIRHGPHVLKLVTP